MKNIKDKRIGLLFDSIRSPYDIANVLQVAIALDCDLYTSGTCLEFDHKKIRGKVMSWRCTKYPVVKHYPKIEDAIIDLKSQGNLVIGTSPQANNDFYAIDAVKNDIIVVFGNESSGLSKNAMQMLDGVVKIPMQNLGFLTLSIVVPAIAYELNRQIELAQKKTLNSEIEMEL